MKLTAEHLNNPAVRALLVEEGTFNELLEWFKQNIGTTEVLAAQEQLQVKMKRTSNGLPIYSSPIMAKNKVCTIDKNAGCARNL